MILKFSACLCYQNNEKACLEEDIKDVAEWQFD